MKSYYSERNTLFFFVFFFTVKLLTSDVNDGKYHLATLWFLNTCSFTLLVRKRPGKSVGSVSVFLNIRNPCF